MSSLRSPENAQVNSPSSEDADSKKIEEEFEQYQEKLKQQKAEWEKEHPDQVRIILMIPLDIFEGKDSQWWLLMQSFFLKSSIKGKIRRR